MNICYKSVKHIPLFCSVFVCLLCLSPSPTVRTGAVYSSLCLCLQSGRSRDRSGPAHTTLCTEKYLVTQNKEGKVGEHFVNKRKRLTSCILLTDYVCGINQ